MDQGDKIWFASIISGAILILAIIIAGVLSAMYTEQETTKRILAKEKTRQMELQIIKRKQ